MSSIIRITQVKGQVFHLKGDDIDTDRIISARFLKCVTFDELGPHTFEDDRKKDPLHPFDLDENQGGKILVVDQNFGCGSSREHAPQALKRWGIDGIIGLSFADIFRGNSLAIGLVLAEVTPEIHGEILDLIQSKDQPSALLDVSEREVIISHGDSSEIFPVIIQDSAKQALLSGDWDAMGKIASNQAEIDRVFERLPY